MPKRAGSRPASSRADLLAQPRAPQHLPRRAAADQLLELPAQLVDDLHARIARQRDQPLRRARRLRVEQERPVRRHVAPHRRRGELGGQVHLDGAHGRANSIALAIAARPRDCAASRTISSASP